MRDAKAYLRKVKWLDAQIDGMIQEVDRLNALATKVTATLSQVVVTRSTDPGKSEDNVIKIVELKNDINRKVDEFVDLKRDIEYIIQKVEDADQVAVLRKRYFEYKTWEQIAVEVGCKYRNVHYIHGDALKAVNALLGDGKGQGETNACGSGL